MAKAFMGLGDEAAERVSSNGRACSRGCAGAPIFKAPLTRALRGGSGRRGANTTAAVDAWDQIRRPISH